MRKKVQGKYEIFTYKEDAIRKFRKLQGVCRGQFNNGNPMDFRCSKKGKITIQNAPTQSVEHTSATRLFAEVIEEDGKTYVVYYTMHNKAENVLKIILLVSDLLLLIYSFTLAVQEPHFIFLTLGLLSGGALLLANISESRNAPMDFAVMINELENRVEAVNLWDK